MPFAIVFFFCRGSQGLLFILMKGVLIDYGSYEPNFYRTFWEKGKKKVLLTFYSQNVNVKFPNSKIIFALKSQIHDHRLLESKTFLYIFFHDHFKWSVTWYWFFLARLLALRCTLMESFLPVDINFQNVRSFICSSSVFTKNGSQRHSGEGHWFRFSQNQRCSKVTNSQWVSLIQTVRK